MSSGQHFPILTCEQLYQVWLSEPEAIRILDLRSPADFQRAHIPGAISVTLAEIPVYLKTLEGRLGVLVVDEDDKGDIETRIQASENYVFLARCRRWMELQLPVTGALQISKMERTGPMNQIIFHQLFEAETSTMTYLIADPKTKEAALIDPVLQTVERDLQLIEELGLRLLYVLDTHIHADHVTGAGEIRRRTGAKTAVSREAQVDCADLSLEEGQELLLGDRKIRVLATPGHTATCLSFVFEGMVFTGDALLIRGCGRTDFQQGNADQLYSSIHEKIFRLPDETRVYPGHDYRGMTSSTVGDEKKHNPRLGEKVSRAEFIKIMSELRLAPPKKIHEALPANLSCGKKTETRIFQPRTADGVPEVSPEELTHHLTDRSSRAFRMIDVRREDEFKGELGHIEGAELVSLGPDLTRFLEQGDRNEEIVFVCRSGGRSGQATVESQKLGYKRTVNLVGGMLAWNRRGLPVSRRGEGV